jgi:pyruvate carboxylase
VDALHAGYGLLSENPKLSRSCAENGITFVGPTPDNLEKFGNKAMARHIAVSSKVPVVPGSEEAFATVNEARAWISDPANKCSYPVIVKALMGGGGRGIRIVLKEEDLEAMFAQASNEALNAFGDGSCFIEKYVETPRHIEVQCLGDGVSSAPCWCYVVLSYNKSEDRRSRHNSSTFSQPRMLSLFFLKQTGNVVHLWDRDCSVQRRHQKVRATCRGLHQTTSHRSISSISLTNSSLFVFSPFPDH